jgi:hypothetical protein
MSRSKIFELHYFYFLYLSSSLLVIKINSLKLNFINYSLIILVCYLIFFVFKHQKVRLDLFYMINSLILVNFYIFPFSILYLLLLVIILKSSFNELKYLFKYLALFSFVAALFYSLATGSLLLSDNEFSIFATFLIVYQFIFFYVSEKTSWTLFVFFLIDKLVIISYLCIGLIRFQDDFLISNLILLIYTYLNKNKSL